MDFDIFLKTNKKNMKYTKQQIVDEKYLIFIANAGEFNTLRKNGFELTGNYRGAYCYSEFDKSYSSSSTKTTKGGYKGYGCQDQILIIHDIELPTRFPFKLTEENFLKLIKGAAGNHKKLLCEWFTPEIFIETFVMIKEDYYKMLREEFKENGQKVLDEIFGADVQEKPFPKFMKSKITGVVVLFSEPKNGMVIKISKSSPLAYQSSHWDMDSFTDVEIEIIEKL